MPHLLDDSGRRNGYRVLDQPESDPGEDRQSVRSVIDAIVDPQILFEPIRDREGCITDFRYHEVNLATCEYLGMGREDLIGQTLVNRFPDAVESGLFGLYVRCVETGEPAIFDEFRFADGNGGKSRRYDIRGARTPDGWVSVNCRDVTDRYDVSARVAESEERYRALLDHSLVATSLNSPDGRFVLVNQAMCELLGYDTDTLLTLTWRDVMAPESLETETNNVKAIAEGRLEKFRVQTELIHADGRQLWGDLLASCLRGSDGTVQHVIAQIIDVTAEVQTRTQLAKARRRQAAADALYRRSMDSAAIGMALTRPDGTIIDVNNAVCRFLGYDAETLLAKSWIELTGPDSLDETLRLRDDIVAGRSESNRMVKQYVHADGHLIWADLSVGCVRRPDGTVQALIAQIVDITAEVQAKEALEKAHRLLEASAESMLDPQVLFEAVRDVDGRIVDFRYASVNQASCLYLQVSAEELLSRTALDTFPNLEGSGLFGLFAQCVYDGEPLIISDFPYFNEMLEDARRYDIRATRAGTELLSLTWSDVTDRYEAACRLALSEEHYRLLAQNAGDLVTRVRDNRFIWLSPSAEAVLGAPADYWIGRDVREIIPPEERAELYERLAILNGGGSLQRRVRVVGTGGVRHWIHVHARAFYDAEGRQDGFIGALRVIDDEVAAQHEAEEARRQQARADELYRRSVDNAAVGMCLVSPEGRFVEVNDALCGFFGYDAPTLKQKTWQQLTAPASLEPSLSNVVEVLDGRRESYRMLNQYRHADGHLVWGDLSVGCLRTPTGAVEHFVAQITDVTAEVEARARLAERDEEKRVLAERLSTELRSAADYVVATLPGEMHGPVEVSSCYLPSQELGGDSFHYRWLDEDLFKFYLIDVSGHGIRPALLATSVHNLIRSGTFPTSTLLRPDRVLTRLNNVFRMEDQGGSYFTIWYGIYELSTRTLRYASAGHPPVLAFNADDDGQPTALTTMSPPIGLFDDSIFQSGTYTVPVGCRMLLFSDGAFELSLPDGKQLSLGGFTDIATQLAATDDFSAHTIVEQLREKAENGAFDDDCSLVSLEFR